MSWLRNRSLLFKMLAGGLSTIAVIVLVEVTSGSHFWKKHDQALEIRRIAFSIQVHMLQALRAEKDFLLSDLSSPQFFQSGDSRNLERHRSAMSKLQKDLEEMLTDLPQEERASVEVLRNLTETYEQTFEQLRELKKNEGPATSSVASAPSTTETELFETMQRAVNGFEPIINRLVNTSVAVAEKARSDFDLFNRIVGIASLAFGFVMVYFFARSLSKPITKLKSTALEIGKGNLGARIDSDSRDEIGVLAGSFSQMISNLLTLIQGVKYSGIHVTSSSTQIAAAARQLEATVTQQAASTNQVAVTAKEIFSISRELAETVKNVHRVAEDTRLLAEAGQGGLVRIETTVQKLVEAAALISARFADVSEKTGRINSVINTITRVADQTNLLSFNAAIEAEKAGEFGLGFSVVAREIRRLADQTAVSTLDIERMVKEMQTAVSTGVLSMEQFSEEVRRAEKTVQEISLQLSQIIAQVQELTPSFRAVNEGMESQSAGAEQITGSMVDLSEAAQHTAQSVHELNRITAELNEAARTLQTEVSRFKVP